MPVFKKIACLVNDSRNCFLSLDAFLQKYKVKCNFLQYFSLLSAIPSRWKSILKRKEHHHVTDVARTQLAIFELSSKTIYNTMINQRKCSPITEKRLIECGFDTQKQQSVFSLPFRVTKEVKLSIFQYKIVYNILYANNILYKIKKKKNHPYCPFCTNIEQTIAHLFFTCSVAELFWSEFTTWHNSLSEKKKLALSKTEIIYGVLDNWSSCLTLNHLILIGKYSLY